MQQLPGVGRPDCFPCGIRLWDKNLEKGSGKSKSDGPLISYICSIKAQGSDDIHVIAALR